MAMIQNIEVRPLPYERFDAVLDEEGQQALQALVDRARAAFGDRVIWCINSTAQGGGVAEMLASLLAYTSGAGIDSRWVVINGTPDFFRLTKRLHNWLHGAEGDGGPLGDAERELYERTLADHAKAIGRHVSPGDVVLVHDPQPAGLVESLKELGAEVVWRLHIGADVVNERARAAQEFLLPYVRPAGTWVFSRREFFWPGLDAEGSHVIPPSIDIFSPKNQELTPPVVDAILCCAGITADGSTAPPEYLRENGTIGIVMRKAQMVEERQVAEGVPMVLQVGRWDRLKDPVGVLRGFAEHVAPRVAEGDLVLAGPEATSIQDDPEGVEVLREVEDAVRALPAEVRERIHLALLPMDDREENAAIVNALQRRASVVVQKSLAEGFGLTVSEGMWKGRPIVASSVGGIADQVVDGETGRLIADAHDLRAFGDAVVEVLEDPERAARMGQAGRQRVLEHFIGVRHLGQWVDLIEELVGARVQR